MPIEIYLDVKINVNNLDVKINFNNNLSMDHVDKIINQWRQERRQLNTKPMATIGRVMRLSIVFGREMEKTFKSFGLNFASFDVLATLRRAGEPYALSPGDLIESTMVTSGTMTNRIDQLAKNGLVKRLQSKYDKRSVLISLTEKGFDVIDAAIGKHVETQEKLTSMLTKKEQESLDKILRKMTTCFE